MPRTPAEEAQYQQLGRQLGFFGGPVADPNAYGTGGYAARTLANVLPGATEKLIQPAQSLLGLDERTQVPNFFDVRPPSNLTEGGINIAGNIAQYLPAIALTEAGGASALTELGAGATTARVGGAALGFGLPSAPEGGESAVSQGLVGGLQSAARDFGWRGKVAAGLIGGGIGYYEGQKQSPTAGLIQGGLNALAPTVIDSIVDKILGPNKAAAAAGQAAEAQSTAPNQPTGPIPFAVSPDGPKDVAALQIAPNQSAPQPNGLSFFNAPTPGQPLTLTPPDGAITDIGGGRPIIGQPANGIAPSSSMSANLANRRVGLPIDKGNDVGYSPGSLAPYDAFAGLQKPPILSQGETFPPAAPRPLFVGSNVTGVLGKGADFTYGRSLDAYDAFRGTDRVPSQEPLSPVEQAAKAKFQADQTPATPPVQESATPPTAVPTAGAKVKDPASKIPTGLQKLLGDDVGWTDPGTPLKEGFTQDAYNLGKKFKNQKDVDRAQKTADAYGKAAQQARDVGNLDQANEYASRKQYFNEAVEYATGNPPKAALFRRHDPNYTPTVPHPEWTKMVSAGLDAPVPKVGDQVVHWTDDGMPLDVTVTGQKDNAVNYTQHDFMTGANDSKVATLQEFDNLQKHPQDRAAAQIKDDAAAPAPPPTPTRPSKPGESPAPEGAIQQKFQDRKGRNLSLELSSKESAVRVSTESGEEIAQAFVHKNNNGQWAVMNVNVDAPYRRAGIASKMYDELEKAGYKLQPSDHVHAGDADAYLTDDGAAFWKNRNKANTPITDQVKVKGKYGWETANVVGRDGDTLHVEVDDPIFGTRRTSVLESDTQPVASLQTPATPKDGVPFQDVESEKLTGKEGISGTAQVGESEADLRGSVYEGTGPKDFSGKAKTTLSVEEGLKKLPPEAASIIGNILNRIQEAAGQKIETGLAQKMVGAKAGMYEMSGRVALNLNWISKVVGNWDKMSDTSRSNALMRVAALFGHEVTHVAQIFGERSNLMIDGKPLIQAIMDKVDALSPGQRLYIQEQIKAAKGELSGGVSKYLAGDEDAAYNFYKKLRPGLTREAAKQLAAGEFMAEVGSTELIKRMKVEGLPTGLRGAIDRFKQVLSNVIDWFRGNGQDSGVAALQNLSDIANKMYDHFHGATDEDLGNAYPANNQWTGTQKPNPFLSGKLPPTQPPSEAVVVNNTPLLKSEIARLGLRASVGAVGGGLIVPAIGGNQTSVAEGMMLGAVAGLFGPVIVKKLLSGNFPQEIAEAFKTSRGNPIKTMAAILGNKSLRDMGLEARYGWTGEASTMSKFVRILETEFNLNLDPKMKALVEEGRGQGTMVLASVQDALDKIRWYKPNDSTSNAVEMYFTGKLDKDQFMKLMDSPELNTYGQSMVTAREGMTTLTKMFASGMSPSNFKDQLIKTADNYLGRFYSAYKEGKFNMEAFDAAKKEMMAKYHDMNDQMADDILREHMREVQANRSMFGGRRGNSGQKIDTGLMSRRLATEEEIEAQKVVVGGLEHDPYGADYLKEKGKLDWMESHKIGDAWRDWLGEYKSPTERMIYTFQKVHSSAISGSIFSMLDDRINSNGLRFTYTPTGLAQARENIASELAKAAHPEDIARMQNQLKELSGYGALPQGSAYGRLAGKWVDRFTRDEMNTYSTPFKWMEQPVIRGISAFNNMIKISRTALNPLTSIRNYIQLPLFGLIAKATPGDIAEAYREINVTKGDTYKLMLQRHIIGADYVANELSNGPGHLLSGFQDGDIAMKLARYGIDKAMSFYQQPDLLLRSAAFIAARRRAANEAFNATDTKFASLQDAMNHPDTIDKATEFTNRYTMNYSAVPRIIKVSRQLPFVNLFISYAGEITRILKNLTEDAIAPGPNSAGRMHAVTVLGAMAAIPAMLTASFEGNLSKQDQADWDKVKTLSPDETRARFKLPLYRDKDGSFHYMDITNLLPADSVSQMIKAFSNGDYKAAKAANPIFDLQNTPLLSMATEQISGQELNTGRKIDGTFGRVREILKETLPPILPPGYEGTRLINAFSTNDQGGQGLTNMRSGVQYKPSDVIANYLTAMKFGNVQLATVQRQAVGQTQQDLATQQALLRDVVNTNTTPEEKQRATGIYNKAQEEIMFKLHQRLGQ